MSQDYKSRFSQMQDNNLTTAKENAVDSESNDHYAAAGHVRNLCFAWPDGRRMFLNYSYLVSGDYQPDDNMIVLSFTTHVITLKGLKLASLFDELMEQITRVIPCIEARYKSIATEGPAIYEIITVTL